MPQPAGPPEVPIAYAPQRVRSLTIDDLEKEAAAYDAVVALSPDVDQFCSSHAFVHAAFTGLQPGRTARIYAIGDAANPGYLAFAERSVGLFGDPRPRPLWEPFEAMWGLASPVVGTDVRGLALALRDRLIEDGPAAVLLCGLREGSPQLVALVRTLDATHRIHGGRATDRQVASLEGGVDGFLSRRSARFRANLRRALKAAAARGLQHERIVPSSDDEVRALYERVVSIDDRSWKGHAEAGLKGSGLYAFYLEMLPRLLVSGGLRFHFLVEKGEDVAYLFGGRVGDTFRGLQFAFVAGHERESLGNLAQYHALSSLCDEGTLRYDLGTSSEYKLHWGEAVDRSLSFIAVPRSRAG